MTKKPILPYLVGRLPDGRPVVQFKAPGVEVLDVRAVSCRECGEVYFGNVHTCQEEKK